MLSEGDKIEFLVKRNGEEKTLTTEFSIPKTKWYKRKGMREVGIWVENKIILENVLKGGPAEKAGLKAGDQIISANGESMRSRQRLMELIKNSESKELLLVVKRGEGEERIPVKPLTPTNLEGAQPMIGVHFERGDEFTSTIYHPGPFEQVGDSVRMM